MIFQEVTFSGLCILDNKLAEAIVSTRSILMERLVILPDFDMAWSESILPLFVFIKFFLSYGEVELLLFGPLPAIF